MSNYFPFGFRYPTGPSFPYSDSNPDPAIETLKGRVAYLNACHDYSPLEGHIFAAALKMLQENSTKDVEDFWALMQQEFDPAEVAEMAMALAPMVADEPPRLDFPNAIALVDCRFVSTLEWQHLRRYSLGGSEAAVVVGKLDENGDQIDGYTQLSKFQTRRGLFYEKQATFVEVPNTPSKEYIFSYGHCVEPYVIQKAAAEVGAKQYPEYRMFAHRDYGFITCNPDGILIFPDGSLCLFEAKTATRHKKDDWADEIPGYYIPQPRQYMEVLDDPRIVGGYIGCGFGSGKFDRVLHKYERDWILGKKQIEITAKFWNDYIAAGVLPPLSGKAELDMEVVYGYGNAPSATAYAVGAGQDLPADSETKLTEYLALKDKKKLLESDMNVAKSKESDVKAIILRQVPEGLSVIQQPNELSYRVSLTLSPWESVDLVQMQKLNPQAVLTSSAFAKALEEEEIGFCKPKVTFARTKAKKTTKKGA